MFMEMVKKLFRCVEETADTFGIELDLDRVTAPFKAERVEEME